MQGNEAILHIHTSTHLEGTAHEDTHLSGTYFSKQLLFSGIGIGIVDEGNLLCRYTGIDQLGANVIINGEFLFFRNLCQSFQSMNLRTVQSFTLGCCGLLGSGNIAEYKLS